MVPGVEALASIAAQMIAALGVESAKGARECWRERALSSRSTSAPTSERNPRLRQLLYGRLSLAS